MFKKKQLIVIMFLPVYFSACTKNTFSITAAGSKASFPVITTAGKQGLEVNAGMVCTVTNF